MSPVYWGADIIQQIAQAEPSCKLCPRIDSMTLLEISGVAQPFLLVTDIPSRSRPFTVTFFTVISLTNLVGWLTQGKKTAMYENHLRFLRPQKSSFQLFQSAVSFGRRKQQLELVWWDLKGFMNTVGCKASLWY